MTQNPMDAAWDYIADGFPAGRKGQEEQSFVEEDPCPDCKNPLEFCCCEEDDEEEED